MRVVSAIACGILSLLAASSAQAEVTFNTASPVPPRGLMDITVTLKSVAVPPASVQGGDRETALNEIRREAKDQCPSLAKVYDANCRVTSVNIFRLQSMQKDGPPSFSITGTAKYELKTSDGDTKQ